MIIRESDRPLLAIGTRMYNRGDMANQPHFGTITNVKTDRWGTEYEITPDADSDRIKPYWVHKVAVSPEDKGDCGTRIVTEEAYNARRAQEIAKMLAWREGLGIA